jgi:hypothetical protein
VTGASLARREVARTQLGTRSLNGDSKTDVAVFRAYSRNAGVLVVLGAHDSWDFNDAVLLQKLIYSKEPCSSDNGPKPRCSACMLSAEVLKQRVRELAKKADLLTLLVAGNIELKLGFLTLNVNICCVLWNRSGFPSLNYGQYL